MMVLGRVEGSMRCVIVIKFALMHRYLMVVDRIQLRAKHDLKWPSSYRTGKLIGERVAFTTCE